MKRIALFGLSLVLAFQLLGQDVLKGLVVNSTDKSAIFMAEVIWGNEIVYTNSRGEFVIQVQNKDSVIKIAKAGYNVFSKAIENERFLTFELNKITFQENQLDEDTDELVLYDTFSQPAEAASGMHVKHKHIKLETMNMAISMPSPPLSYESNESFSEVKESGFQMPTNNPLSTFSIDVDAASYAIMRRDINRGILPNQNSVRVEEMINYFTYNYEKPSGNDPISVESSVSLCPWNENNALLRLGIQSKAIATENLPQSNFVFLIDVSGSMSAHDKLPLAKTALKSFLKTLRSDDRVAIVTYAGSVNVVLKSTPVSSKQDILRALDKLNSGGSTAGAEGLKLAYSEAEYGFIAEGNNRIILVTDGDFNVGPSSVDDLIQLIKSKRDKGIYISILGFGSGNIKDDRMEAIADNGNGNYAYVDNLQEAQKILMKEFSSNLFVVAKDVKIQVEFNPNVVAAYRLVGYDNRLLEAEDFNNDKKDAGDMGADQQVTALYEISLVGSNGKPTVDPLKYSSSNTEKKFSDEMATVKVRYKEPNETESKLILKSISTRNISKRIVNEDFSFAASVAMFGQLLRSSDYVVNGDLSTVANLAVNSRSSDVDGYKSEFLRLVQVAEGLFE